jgi:hypothetical protein
MAYGECYYQKENGEKGWIIIDEGNIIELM